MKLKIKDGAQDMFKWLGKLINPEPKEQYVGNEASFLSSKSPNVSIYDININNVLISWFDNLDKYADIHRATYGSYYGVNVREVNPNMDFTWGCWHSSGGASYYTRDIHFIVTKDRYFPINYKSKIIIPSSKIVIWENGVWIHEIPSELKEIVEKHLAIIKDFNTECGKINFNKIISEEEKKRYKAQEEKKLRKLKEEKETIFSQYNNK
jgi:hypothetical protein